MSARGAGHQQIIKAFPERMLRGLGYFGPAAGAAEALRRFAGAADIAVVRLVPARPGVEAIHAILDGLGYFGPLAQHPFGERLDDLLMLCAARAHPFDLGDLRPKPHPFEIAEVRAQRLAVPAEHAKPHE